MPDIIHLLPDNIANQIAAGEVIQRPASAVKELLENSIDSGATEVKLILKDAGKTLIQVIDNGCGMSETDARMAFERHATSKITKIDDLFAIRTMGFRGEALASIAAVAQVEVKTKKVEDELGALLEIEGSGVKRQEPCQCTAGTSIAVKNLFFNVPARRNFLKFNNVETKHIIDEFQRVALAHPHIAFTFHHNGLEIFHLPKGNLRQRIVGALGKNYDQRLVPVQEETDIIKISGYISKPQFSKKTRGEQFFFVNNRFIKSPYLHHSVMSAYSDLISRENYPLYALFIDIDPKNIDINVHPTKQEIKFDDEKLVYSFIRAASRHALGQYSITPTLDFEQERSFSGFNIPAPVEQNGERSNPASVKAGFQNWNSAHSWHGLPENNDESTVTLKTDWQEQKKIDHEFENEQEEKKAPYQIHNRFIISPIKSGFVCIDQQAAHERILYEGYLKALSGSRPISQKQLFPQTIELAAADFQLMKEILEEVNALGFDIQEFGKNSLVIHSMPADILGSKIEQYGEEELIENLLEQYKKNKSALKLDRRESLARAMAKNTAVKNGQKLHIETMKTLIDKLFACEMPYKSPTGKATFLTFQLDELEKQLEKG